VAIDQAGFSVGTLEGWVVAYGGCVEGDDILTGFRLANGANEAPALLLVADESHLGGARHVGHVAGSATGHHVRGVPDVSFRKPLVLVWACVVVEERLSRFFAELAKGEGGLDGLLLDMKLADVAFVAHFVRPPAGVGVEAPIGELVEQGVDVSGGCGVRELILAVGV
jgi:hypothetical protein